MAKKPLAYRGNEPFVFVSYAHADAELAYPLISGLQERGLRIWFDDGMDVGDLWDEVIPDHVEQCAAMLCLVSTRFTDSNNCLDEIHYAKEQKKELLILHLENEELPRSFRFRYGRFHALKLSDYSEQSRLVEKLAATPKLRCCLGQVKEENPEELHKKGEACYFGNGVPQSYAEAVKWYRKAAELGHPGAMRGVGFCYGEGHGVSQSLEEAVKWYRRAADLGDAKAMHNLGNCYYQGRGVSRSYEEAVTWYRRAADKGVETAMNNLGYCYDRGQGVTQSHEEAAKWFRRAADKGDADAMNNLAYSYRQGQGVSQSNEEAVRWFRRAADKGDATGMRGLGNCYAFGWGVEQDQNQAEYWRNKAKEAERNASK